MFSGVNFIIKTKWNYMFYTNYANVILFEVFTGFQREIIRNGYHDQDKLSFSIKSSKTITNLQVSEKLFVSHFRV